MVMNILVIFTIKLELIKVLHLLSHPLEVKILLVEINKKEVDISIFLKIHLKQHH